MLLRTSKIQWLNEMVFLEFPCDNWLYGTLKIDAVSLEYSILCSLWVIMYTSTNFLGHFSCRTLSCSSLNSPIVYRNYGYDVKFLLIRSIWIARKLYLLVHTEIEIYKYKRNIVV